MSPRPKRPAPAAPRTAIGIDVGGTGVKAAVVDLVTGELASPRLRVKTPQPATPEAVIAAIGGIVDQLVADGVWNTLSFGPALLEGGQVVDGIEDVEVDTNVGNHSIQGAQPRTAVGVVDANHLVFVVVDGRSPGYSAGVTMTGLAEIMQGLGATTAYNLDGGGSSTMYFNGEVVNNPLGKGQERGTSDILYIAG